MEFFPRSSRYSYDSNDLVLKIPSIKSLPSLIEYRETRELLDEELRVKFPNYESYIKNSLNEHIAKNILKTSLNLIAKNHKLKPKDVSGISLQAFNLVNLYYKIDTTSSFDERVKQLESKIQKSEGKGLRLTGFSFGDLQLNLKVLKKSFETFVDINGLKSNIYYEKNEVAKIEKVFLLKTRKEIKDYFRELIKNNYISFYSSSSAHFLDFISDKVLQFSYDLLMTQIDNAVLVEVKKQKRKEAINKAVERTSSRYPFLSIFVEQSHLGKVKDYLVSLPNSPLLKPNLEANGMKVKCNNNCDELINNYKKYGDEFLNSLEGASEFNFLKYPENKISKELAEKFFNPLNQILGNKVAATFGGEIYFLTRVNSVGVYEIESTDKEYRDLVNREYQNQRIYNLFYLCFDEVFYQMNFSHILPTCFKGICSDIIDRQNIGSLVFHLIKNSSEFKILQPKAFLREIF